VRELSTFALRSERDGGTHTVAASGELDLATAPDFEAELLRVEATDAQSIVLDLTDVEFIASTGIGLIISAEARSRADFNRLSLLRPTDSVFRVFAICGIADRLPFAD
jgi:anti-sigma B factor antagonist